jgi:hypothetical protein
LIPTPGDRPLGINKCYTACDGKRRSCFKQAHLTFRPPPWLLFSNGANDTGQYRLTTQPTLPGTRRDRDAFRAIHIYCRTQEPTGPDRTMTTLLPNADETHHRRVQPDSIEEEATRKQDGLGTHRAAVEPTNNEARQWHLPLARAERACTGSGTLNGHPTAPGHPQPPRPQDLVGPTSQPRI